MIYTEKHKSLLAISLNHPFYIVYWHCFELPLIYIDWVLLI